MAAIFCRIRRAVLLARMVIAGADLDWALRHAPDMAVEKRKALWRAEQALERFDARHPVRRVSMDALVVVVSAGGALPFLFLDLLEKF